MSPDMNLILFVLGVCVSSGISKQFVFVNLAKTFNEAQKYCRTYYYDLATVENETDFSKLEATVNSVNEQSVWIGLKKGQQSRWFWSLSDSRFYRDKEADYRRWRSGQLDNYGGIEYCAAVDDGGEFWDIPCESQFQFICFDGQDSAVQKYVFVSQKQTWRDAQKFCRLKYTDLVSVRNPEENQQVQQLVPRGTLLHIGLYKDMFSWSDNSDSLYRRWPTGEPDYSGDCVEQRLSDLKMWADQNCDQTRPFVCYDVMVRTQILKVKLTSAQSVNDPAMTQTIMEKIQQKLVSLGMSEDAKLQWRVQSDGEIFQPLHDNTHQTTIKC